MRSYLFSRVQRLKCVTLHCFNDDTLLLMIRCLPEDGQFVGIFDRQSWLLTP